jgi:hypothetical protein
MYRNESMVNLPAVGPGAGAYAYPASVTLDAQGRVTAVGSDFTQNGFTMSTANGNITLANNANALQSASSTSIRMRSGQANGTTPAYILDTLNTFNDNYIYSFKNGGTDYFKLYKLLWRKRQRQPAVLQLVGNQLL